MLHTHGNRIVDVGVAVAGWMQKRGTKGKGGSVGGSRAGLAGGVKELKTTAKRARECV